MICTVLAVENITHGLCHASLSVDVELCQGVIHGVRQPNDAGQLVVAPAPVEGGQVDASQPVDGLGKDKDGSNSDHSNGGNASDV